MRPEAEPIMDPIADLLSTIKNAQMVGKAQAELPYSKIKEALALLLEKEGYLSEVKVFKPKGSSFKLLSLGLKYLARPDEPGARREGEPSISKVRRISRPGRRVYVGKGKLPRVLGGRGVAIVSTPRGLMTAREARKRDLGGEVICEVW